MSLEEDLKAKTLALISGQMANWVVDIQRQIQAHQASLVAALDDLGEGVARYDERINEEEIAAAMAEVVASQPPPPPPPPVGPGMDQLRASVLAIERGSSLSEVLTYLVNEVAHYVDRAAMFIVKGTNAIGWYGKGFEPPDVVKQVNVALSGDTAFKAVFNSRQAHRGALSQSPATAQALLRLGGTPNGILAVPLILRDKVAAVLYCDTQGEVPDREADLVEVLVLFAGKTIDLLSLAPKPAAAKPPAPAPAPAAPPARPAPAPAHAEPARPAPRPAPPAVDEGSSTVMFNAQQFASLRQPAAPTPPPPPPPKAAAIPPEEQKAHDDAKRFARLVVSEIKLYNEAKVSEGRKNKDLYERLKEDIERGRQMYQERVAPQVRESTNYFYDELVRILAGGDASALGTM